MFLFQASPPPGNPIQDTVVIIGLIASLITVLSFFATVVAMFVSLRGKVENQQEDIKEISAQTQAIPRMDERLKAVERRVNNNGANKGE